MKKKVIFITCGIVIVAAITAMLVFVFHGEDGVEDNQINVLGTWKVAVYSTGNSVSLIENEFMVFDEKTAKDYRDNSSEPYAESTYSIDSNLTLQLPELSRSYTIKSYTQNYIRLYQNKDTYLDLIKYPNADMSATEIETNSVFGRWNINYRNTDELIVNEYLIFENDTLSDYRNDASEPTITADYHWDENNHLISNLLDKDMILNIVSSDTIVLIETDTGYIWELQKAQ